MSSLFIGPALPPSLQKQKQQQQEQEEEEKQEEQKREQQPKKRVIGPQRPSENESEETPSEAVNETENIERREEQKTTSSIKRPTVTVGPLIGPRPPQPGSQSDSDSDEDDPLLNARPKGLNQNLPKTSSSSNSVPIRDHWMTELPEARSSASLLVNRQFSKTGNYTLDRGDTSGWTDTPSSAGSTSSKAPSSKPKISGIEEKHYSAERDKKMEAVVKRYEKERGESLFEQHQKGSKRKSETNEEKEEYKPFDREKDLDVRRTDPTRVKKLVQESRQLNDRFSSSSSRKYL